MQHNSRPVLSNQPGPHHHVARRVERALASPLRKPIAEHTRQVFQQAQAWKESQTAPLILDSGCGVGLSTRRLAQQFPTHSVIGIDRSADRLSRNHGELPKNALLLRGDLVDFWRLAYQAGWVLDRHFLLYPNPYPKSGHLKMRWHGHPVFPTLLALGGQLEVRSNWALYVEEFAHALMLVTGRDASVNQLNLNREYLTPFEEKYDQSGQVLWQLSAMLERT